MVTHLKDKSSAEQIVCPFTVVDGSMLIIERLRYKFTPNGKRESVPRDQVSPLIVLYCLLLLLKNKTFHASFIHKNCSREFLSAYFYSEKFSAWFWRHFHISHNAPYLPPPPQFLHNLCFSSLPGITAVPREIENNAYEKFGGANKVHYGKCGSGV